MQFEMNPCSDPTVSVVMPVYNAGEFLQEAVQSVLDQTFRCFEVIVIDDGSTDNSSEILKSFQKLDTRIAMYHQENSGVIASLNRGCKLAKGKYIARMDADDVCHPVRLEKQISFLEKHPEVGILGSAAFIVNEFGATVDQIVVPANPALIQWHLAFENCFVHSSVVMRRDVLQALDYYRSGARHAEDYDLWSRATDITRLTNLPDSLMKRRVWDGNVGNANSTEQEHTACNVSHSVMESVLGNKVPLETTACVRRVFFFGQHPRSLEEVLKVAGLIRDLHSAYLVKHRLDKSDSRELARNAGLKLAMIAKLTLRFSIWHGVRLIVAAVRLNPGLLTIRTLKRGLHRLCVGISKVIRRGH